MDTAGHSLALQFDTSDAEFARGVEVGRLWEILKIDAGATVVELVHSNNVEMVLRLAEATGRVVSSEELDPTWIEVTFEPSLEDA